MISSRPDYTRTFVLDTLKFYQLLNRETPEPPGDKFGILRDVLILFLSNLRLNSLSL